MQLKNHIMVLAGAVAGGVLGYFIFLWLARHQGLYALAVPGGLVGLGAGCFRNKSLPVAIACGVMAVAIGLFSEWKFAPFIKDESLAYFISHIHLLRPLTLVMVAVGGFIGFWVPFRRG
jgi:hypothetical protein